MSRKALVIGLVVAVAVLAAGAVAFWVLPDRAEARHGTGGGLGNGGTGLGLTVAGGTGGGYRGGRGNVESGMQGGVGLDGTCAGGESVVSGSLTDAEVRALTAALEDEHRAKALYEQAIADLGNVRPLTQIVRAEERHIAALERIFTRYGLEIPAVEAGAEDAPFTSLAEACAAGVAAEEANVVLYDGLFADVEKADVTRVLTALQSASQNSHLPALEACAP